MAERKPLQIVAQIEPGAADDGDRAKAWIIGALANDIRNALVAPEQRDLMDEMGKQLVEIGVWPGARRHRYSAVIENPTIGRQPVALRVAQHLAPVELIERKCSFSAREPH